VVKNVKFDPYIIPFERLHEKIHQLKLQVVIIHMLVIKKKGNNQFRSSITNALSVR